MKLIIFPLPFFPLFRLCGPKSCAVNFFIGKVFFKIHGSKGNWDLWIKGLLDIFYPKKKQIPILIPIIRLNISNPENP
jgi:hypothetical protein